MTLKNLPKLILPRRPNFMKIVFMGTPEFAVESLEKIYHSHHKVLAVVTSPDRPAGRGLKLKYSAVKEFALKNNIPCLQPEKLKDPDFVNQLKDLGADAFVVIAFRMLPQIIWEIPPFGTINIHASLLPEYRGAAPINHAIIHGENQTGVTSFLIQKEIDTGDILLQQSCEIKYEDTAQTLHDRLKKLGADLILKTLDGLEQGKIIKSPQADFMASPKNAPKLTTENTRINFGSNAEDIRNFCRGLNPFPGAWCVFKHGEEESLLKVFSVKTKTGPEMGGIEITNDGIRVPCADGKVLLEEVQPAGKKRMSGGEFARGIKGKKGLFEII